MLSAFRYACPSLSYIERAVIPVAKFLSSKKP
uniref:Uncharacterized protein n=1 Tax=Arundo donax TaxID=35708 RepID=A0A0A9FSR2_ARUDO